MHAKDSNQPCGKLEPVLNSQRVQGEEELSTCEESSCISAELKAIYATQREWTWRGYSIVYTVQGSGPPVLLVHGFGATIGHWRR